MSIARRMKRKISKARRGAQIPNPLAKAFGWKCTCGCGEVLEVFVHPDQVRLLTGIAGVFSNLELCIVKSQTAFLQMMKDENVAYNVLKDLMENGRKSVFLGERDLTSGREVARSHGILVS
jgi:hypothetical protein